jgi:tetratricopeptide (TPR) repeat protein
LLALIQTHNIKSDDPQFVTKVEKADMAYGSYMKKAIEEFGVAIRVQPKYFDAYLELGDCHTELAERAKTDALKVEDESGTARSKAEYAAELHSAIEITSAAVNLRLDSKEAWTKLGDLWLEAEQYDNARKCLRAAIKIDSEDSNYRESSRPDLDPYLSLKRVFEKAEWASGHLVYNQERVRTGIQEFRSLASQYPKADAIHYCLGELFLKLGDRASALDEYRTLKSMNSGWASVLFEKIYN